MLQRQNNPLNRSRTPERREQVMPGPVRAASSSEIAALNDAIDDVAARATSAEVRIAFAEADIDALQAADLTHSSQISGLQGADAARAAQIAALQAVDTTQAGQITALQTAQALAADGHLTLGVRKVTADASFVATDYLILVDAAAGNVTVTLPALQNGRQVCVKRIDASANSVLIASAANIDGATPRAVTPQYASFTMMCDGATWWII